MLKIGDVIEFDSKKHFKYIRPLGAGGTGDTHLFEDETTDMLFAFKKYAPKDLRYVDENYIRFVNEIKILLRISNPNIVRVYNYYLYPEAKLGYLQMEYVDGISIDKYEPEPWGKQWHDIFIEIVSAFEYLESNNILHRDIRPANILIDNMEAIKIIDFGFGKNLRNENSSDNSVILNWPVTEYPDEITFEYNYNHQTEIYFVGKLFSHLLGNDIEEFKFYHILEKMCKIKPSQRYESFSEVSKVISIGVLSEIDFTKFEKEVYIEFADQLSSHIIKFKDRYTPINNLTMTMKLLADIIRESALEKHIQSNQRLINCFVDGGYSYLTTNDIEVDGVKSFYELLLRLNPRKQKIVLDNIYTRLSKIMIEINDDLPF